jgi:molybdate transport system substrate-binding protein
LTAKIHVLSAGAIEPGLVAAVEAYREQSGQDVRITWATTPAIRKRIGSGEVADVVIATDEAVDDFARDGTVAGQERVMIGRVGIGVVVRKTAPVPDLSSVGALKYAVLDAESVVYNRASSGLYVEKMLTEMGILDRIRAKTSRYGNGPAMMKHLINGKGKEIGFGAIIEILMFRDQGLTLAGPLPAVIQHYTNYVAVPMTAASNPGGAKQFARYLATPAAKAVFAAHGIE